MSYFILYYFENFIKVIFWIESLRNYYIWFLCNIVMFFGSFRYERKRRKLLRKKFLNVNREIACWTSGLQKKKTFSCVFHLMGYTWIVYRNHHIFVFGSWIYPLKVHSMIFPCSVKVKPWFCLLHKYDWKDENCYASLVSSNIRISSAWYHNVEKLNKHANFSF